MARRVGERAQGVTLVLLAGVALAIVAGLATMFAGLEERQRAIEESVREDAQWAAYQADREASRLVEAILTASELRDDASTAELTLRYDILYSRAPILVQASFGGRMGEDDALGLAMRRARDLIIGLAPTLDELGGDRERILSAAPVLLAKAHEIRRATGELVVSANAAGNAARVAARREISGYYRRIGLSVIGLAAAMGLIVALLLLQVAQVKRARVQIEAMNERNVRAAEAAEAGNRAKSSFLAAMSHEIRTPLNGILGAAELLSGSRLSPAQADHLSVIRKSGDLLLDVINDILDFSKLEAGEARVELSEFDLQEVLETVSATMGPRARAKDLGFSILGPDVRIVSDPVRIRQILINFVGNAIKFTSAGSVQVEATTPAPGLLRLAVHDTGPGIRTEDVPKLFREFSQVESSFSRRFGGTGLGLAICKRLAETLGGRVGVETARGRGSCFWAELPADPAGPGRARTPAAAPAPGRFSGRALVVEDNPVNREVACGLLQRLGLEAQVAHDGEAGVAAALASPPAIILMDMQMPGVDGLEATRRLRAAGYAGPIVGLTANAFESDRQACLSAGMDDFLSKPVSTDRLGAMLARWLPAETPAPAPRPTPGAERRAELEEQLGADFVASLVAELHASATARVAEARGAAGDASVWERALHSLKGSAATLGFDEVAELAERCRRHPDPAGLDELEAAIAASIPAPVGTAA